RRAARRRGAQRAVGRPRAGPPGRPAAVAGQPGRAAQWRPDGRRCRGTADASEHPTMRPRKGPAMPSTWSLSRRIWTLSALVAFILAAIAITAVLAAAGNRSDVHRVTDRIDPARANSERMLAALYRQQSAIRTFALTGV